MLQTGAQEAFQVGHVGFVNGTIGPDREFQKRLENLQYRSDA